MVDRVATDDVHVARSLAHRPVEPLDRFGTGVRIVLPGARLRTARRIPEFVTPGLSPVPGNEIDLNKFEPPLSETREIAAEVPLPDRIRRVDRQGLFADIRMERTVPEPRTCVERLYL